VLERWVATGRVARCILGVVVMSLLRDWMIVVFALQSIRLLRGLGWVGFQTVCHVSERVTQGSDDTKSHSPLFRRFTLRCLYALTSHCTLVADMDLKFLPPCLVTSPTVYGSPCRPRNAAARPIGCEQWSKINPVLALCTKRFFGGEAAVSSSGPGWLNYGFTCWLGDAEISDV
jgi:hypothetical protein